jgi:hypothetical protein
MVLPVLFDNYIQISDVYRKDLGAYLLGDKLQTVKLSDDREAPQDNPIRQRSPASVDI